MIVSGGENVFPREVEDLVAGLAGVAEVAVIGVADERVRPAPEGLRRALAEGGASEQDVKDHVRANLARFKVPREVVFLGELPRNAVGKVLKRELAGYSAARPTDLLAWRWACLPVPTASISGACA